MSLQGFSSISLLRIAQLKAMLRERWPREPRRDRRGPGLDLDCGSSRQPPSCRHGSREGRRTSASVDKVRMALAEERSKVPFDPTTVYRLGDLGLVAELVGREVGFQHIADGGRSTLACHGQGDRAMHDRVTLLGSKFTRLFAVRTPC